MSFYPFASVSRALFFFYRELVWYHGFSPSLCYIGMISKEASRCLRMIQNENHVTVHTQACFLCIILRPDGVVVGERGLGENRYQFMKSNETVTAKCRSPSRALMVTLNRVQWQANVSTPMNHPVRYPGTKRPTIQQQELSNNHSFPTRKARRRSDARIPRG